MPLDELELRGCEFHFIFHFRMTIKSEGNWCNVMVMFHNAAIGEPGVNTICSLLSSLDVGLDLTIYASSLVFTC